MRKKSFFAAVLLILSLPVSSVSALAVSTDGARTEVTQSNYSISSFSKKLDTSLSITKYTDGRVEGDNNAKNFTKSQKESFLQEMNFTSTEISRMPEDLKVDLINKGGVKIDLKDTGISEQYTSLDGTVYNIDASNRKEIESIKEADI